MATITVSNIVNTADRLFVQEFKSHFKIVDQLAVDEMKLAWSSTFGRLSFIL